MPVLLLVEDDRFLSDTVKSYLEFRQYDVDRAFEGEEALEKMQYGTYDGIILDWQLPDMEGIEVCKIYRQKGGTTPVLMLSGRAEANAAHIAVQAGASSYLVKPFKLDQLDKSLSNLFPNP